MRNEIRTNSDIRMDDLCPHCDMPTDDGHTHEDDEKVGEGESGMHWDEEEEPAAEVADGAENG